MQLKNRCIFTSSCSLAFLRHSFPATRVFEEAPVDFVGWQVYVSDHRASNEDILYRAEVGVFQFIEDSDVVKFNVQVLVDRL